MNSISIRGLWQSYRVKRFRQTTLKAAISEGARRGPRPNKWALQGVDLDVPTGETLGIIGANGSGKSTLLRCMAGIFRPTRGTVTVRGSQASLIDLTAGFELDLSARDNVYLTGAIYGVPRSIMRERIGSIIEFAGLEGAVEAPLRTFSTGMGLRLGFSVAVSLDPDVLLVDEVLAVGDESFKVRCLEKVRSMREGGTTIVFVSHELPMVSSLCDRVVVLEQGQIHFDGQTESAIDTYCELLGVDREFAMDRPPLDEAGLRRIEHAWRRR